MAYHKKENFIFPLTLQVHFALHSPYIHLSFNINFTFLPLSLPNFSSQIEIPAFLLLDHRTLK